MATPHDLRIGRLGPVGDELPVVEFANTVFDARPVTTDIDGTFLARGGIEQLAAAVSAGTLDEIEPDGLRVGAPIATPSKVVCIGLNYHRHAAETGAAAPDEPIVFMKDPGCVVGPNDTVLIPRESTKTDYEVELAVVIATTCRYLDSPASALDRVAGYAISNDVSEREFQIERSGGQWDKGKSCETFNPLGPWLVPSVAVEPQALDLGLWVNGEQRQSSTTADMIFPVAHLVWYLSQFMVLRPGDVINTGTPEGVALGRPDLPWYLRNGDVVELEIAGLGRQHQSIGQA